MKINMNINIIVDTDMYVNIHMSMTIGMIINMVDERTVLNLSVPSITILTRKHNKNNMSIQVIDLLGMVRKARLMMGGSLIK